jgi:hypothetical protein
LLPLLGVLDAVPVILVSFSLGNVYCCIVHYYGMETGTLRFFWVEKEDRAESD